MPLFIESRCNTKILAPLFAPILCRANDVRSLIVICTNAMCRHEAIVNVDSQSYAAFVPALGRLMRC